MEKVKQIIAMGGGGFTMEPGNPLLDDYVLNQSPKKNPRICLIPTASKDHIEYIRDFYDFFMTRECEPCHLPLSNPPFHDLESLVLANDIIYVSGGNTAYMLSTWKSCRLDAILKKAWEKGIILSGVSAGASCWFEMALTDSLPDQLTGEAGLGFLKGSHCAHYENPDRRPTFHQLIADNELPEGIGTENFAALHFVGDELKKVVSSRPGAAAYAVRKKPDGRISERKFEGIWLGP
jgi:peptidase E